jgi:hypothetical protein
MPDKKNEVQRASAALAAAGAWDTAPVSIDCNAYDWAALYITYAVNAAAVSNTGYAEFKIETTCDSSTWHPDNVVHNDAAVTAVANGLDTWKSKNHVNIIYHDTPGTTTATQGTPKFRVDLQDARKFRVDFREAGELGKPGTVKCTAVLVREQA